MRTWLRLFAGSLAVIGSVVGFGLAVDWITATVVPPLRWVLLGILLAVAVSTYFTVVDYVGRKVHD